MIKRSDYQIFILTFVVTVAVRASMVFASNFGPDTYLFLAYPEAYFFDGFFSDLGQLRFGAAAAHWILDQLGAGFPYAGALFPLLMCAGLAAFGTTVKHLWCPEITGVRGVIIAFAFSSHPYISDLMYTHNGIGHQIFAIAFGSIGLWLAISHPRSAVACIALVPSFYQPVFTWLTAAVFIELLFVVRLTRGQTQSAGSTWDLLIRSAAAKRLLVVACGAVLYLIVALIIARVFHAPRADRTQLVAAAEVLPHLVLVLKMTYFWILKGEAVLPFGIKLIQLVILGIVTWSFLRTKNAVQPTGVKWGGLLLVFALLSAAWLSALALLLPLHEMQPQLNLRTTSALACFWAGMVALAITSFDARAKVPVQILGLAFVASLGMNTNRLASDFARLSERDRLVANRIVERLSLMPDFSSVERVAVLAGSSFNLDHITSSSAGFNASTLWRPWSQTAMLREISGYRFQPPTDADKSLTKSIAPSMPHWPAAGSIVIRGHLAIINLSDPDGTTP